MKAITTRTLTGLLIIAIGAAFLFSNLNILPFGQFVSTWWPLVVIAIGLLILFNNSKNYLWALLVITLGLVLQLNELDIVSVNPWQLFWPAVIILIGASMIFGRSGKQSSFSGGDRQNVSAILGGSDVKIRSEDFKGSKVTAVLGGASVDLRKATIKKEATLDLFSFWGGIEIRVPDGVIVRNDTSVILGGVEDTSSDKDITKDSPTLRIIGDIVMAGVEIRR